MFTSLIIFLLLSGLVTLAILTVTGMLLGVVSGGSPARMVEIVGFIRNLFTKK